MNTKNNDITTQLTAINDANALVDLFAEELPEQHDNARIPGTCCVASLSTIGGCFSSLSSLSTTC